MAGTDSGRRLRLPERRLAAKAISQPASAWNLAAGMRAQQCRPRRVIYDNGTDQEVMQ
jgi:hypothetical protein